MSITPTKDGRWRVEVNLSAVRGQRERAVRLCATEDDAQAVEADLLRQRAAGRPAAVSALLPHLVAVVDRYLDTADHLEPRTRNGYRMVRDRYLSAHPIGWRSLHHVDTASLEAWYRDLAAGRYAVPAGERAARPLAARTVRNVHRVITAACNDAKRLGLIDVNPAADVKLRGRMSAPRARAGYDLANVRAVLRAGASDVELADLVHLSIATSARRSELAALRWGDVDLLTGKLTIDASVTPLERPAQGLMRKATKAEDVRPMKLDATALAMLQARYARHAEQARTAGIDPDDLAGVAILSTILEREFTNPDVLSRRWSRCARTAGTKMRLHDLRHLACSRMLAAGVPLPAATARSGHASNATFLDVYAHALHGSDDAAGAALEATWQGIVSGDA
jgi:integrase